MVWSTDGSKANEGTGAKVYKLGLKKGHRFRLRLHTKVFHEEIYAIKACIMNNIEKGYKGRDIYILSDSQSAIKALNNFQINSTLVWDCDQSLVRLAELNSIEMIWVSGHKGIDGNEMADQVARQGSSCPLTGPEPAMGISTKSAGEVIRELMNRKCVKYWQSIHGPKQAKGFLKRPSAKTAGELLSFSSNQLRIMTGLLKGYCHLKGHLFKLGLVTTAYVWWERQKYKLTVTAEKSPKSHVCLKKRRWMSTEGARGMCP
jgi:ribonuclease HI